MFIKLLNNKIGIILFAIVLLAGVLRFWDLGKVPLSLNWDEAAWGYNAYSLGISGKDEFGMLLPYKYLESYGDYKPPVYAYLDIIPVKLFGLNEFSTRFPSAFFGTLTVLLTFFLVKRIFKNSQKKDLIAIFSAFFLAISPWHINLSRAAFEANVASFFVVLGLWAFLAGVSEKRRYLFISAGSFALTFYIFNTERVVVPILVFILAIIFRKELLVRKKETLVAILIGLAIFLPISLFLLSPQANTRFKEVNIFSDIGVIKNANQEIANDNNSLASKIIHNRRLLFGVDYLQHYFDNFNPNFLFINGDMNLRFSTKDIGQLLIWDLPFLVLGTFLLFRKRDKNWWIVPVWLLIGIIPAATARETPHALRIEVILPTYQILTALGFVYVLDYLNGKKQAVRKTIIVILFLVLAMNMFYYLYGYYSNYPRESANDWQYGYKDSVTYVKKVQNNYNQIFITSALGRPYIYYLFYMKIDPSYFRKTADIKRDVFGFVDIKSFGKYSFNDNIDALNRNGKKTLYINTIKNTPPDAKIIQTFYLPDGSAYLAAYTK